ncbi:MAG: UbiA family prenyltransferase [Candidatus Moraniibacteriota bacterium]
MIIEKIIGKIEDKITILLEGKISIIEGLLAFSLIISLRVFIEFFLASKALSAELIIIEYLHNFLFFALATILLWFNLSFFLKINPKKIARFFLWISWGILFSPLLDMIKTGGEVYWSFYVIGGPKFLFSQYISFFAGLPSGIVYFGTKIVFLSSIILSGLVVLIKTKNIVKSIFSALLAYTVLFIIGSAPSVAAILYYFFVKGKDFLIDMQSVHVIQVLAVPVPIFGVKLGNLAYALPYNLEFILYPLFLGLLFVLFLIIDKKKVLFLLKNSRLPQLIYHSGLFFIGLGLGAWFYRENFSMNVFAIFAALDLLICIWLAWLASVVVNDIYDFSLDLVSNPERPLQCQEISKKEYCEIGWLLFYFSLFGGLLVSFKFFGLLLVYQLIAWAYSASPYRLKRFPIVASFVSAMASLVVFFMGFVLISGDQNIQGLPWRVILLLIISYTLSLPIKDFKDIAGDEKDGIRTIPVIFGEEKGRIVVGSGIFISFVLSVFLLNERTLFFWALLFGGLSYFVVSNKKIHPRKIFWWLLPIIIAYGLILVKTIFGRVIF